MKTFKKIAEKLFLCLVILLVSTFLFAQKVSAESIDFSQSILPVKMVYVDNKGEVKNIWSNVSPADNLYAIKFFGYRDNKEQNPDNKLIANYQRSVIKNFSSDFGSGSNYFCNQKMSLNVEFVNQGSTLEEVRTYS